MVAVTNVDKELKVKLPRSVAERFGISEGSKVIVEVKDDGILLRPVKSFLTKKEFWASTTVEEIEKESEEISRIAEED